MSFSFYHELSPPNYIFAETAMASIHETWLIQHVSRENQHLIPFTLTENQAIFAGVSVHQDHSYSQAEFVLQQAEIDCEVNRQNHHFEDNLYLQW
jgi:hypothetical protein